MTRSTASPDAVLPEWDVSTWLNTCAPITLASLRGRVVLLHAFQMLCPGCVTHGLPQTERVRQTFLPSELAVVGLHTVFEHHEVMTVDALSAFIDEYRWSFPIGVDAPGRRGGPSRTMTTYGLRGTPSCLVLDKQGRVQLRHFGQLDDLWLGGLLGRLIASPDMPAPVHAASEQQLAPRSDAWVCQPEACSTPSGGPGTPARRSP